MGLSRFFDAVLMGIIEGLTEFIPVSSTGHLIVLGALIGFEGPPGKTFEIVIQLGAVAAVCWHFRIKILAMVRGLEGERETGNPAADHEEVARQCHGVKKNDRRSYPMGVVGGLPKLSAARAFGAID